MANPGEGDGETPLPAAEQENVLKKRRALLAHVARAENGGSTPMGFPASNRLADGLLRLKTAGQQANQRLALADKPAPEDPAVRLPPGQAPPDGVHIAA